VINQTHAPLVPPDVDLRDFAFMPLEIRRLFSSETWIIGTHEQKCAALCLWGESWHQVPAASLPDNDRMLAHLSQAGPRWTKIKEHAMRCWILCSDGRWYHPVVAEKALEAWAKHNKASSKGKAGAAKRWGTGKSTVNAAANSTGIDQAMPADSNRTYMGNDIRNDTTKSSGARKAGEKVNAVTLAVALRDAGCSDASGQNPVVIGWAQRGVSAAHVLEALRVAQQDRGKLRPPVRYLAPIVEDLVRAREVGALPNSRTAMAVAGLESLRESS